MRYDANEYWRFLLDTGMFAVIGYYLYKLCRGSEPLQYSPLLRLLVRDGELH